MPQPTAVISGLQAALKNTDKLINSIVEMQQRPLKRALILVETSAKKKAVKDTGRMRSAISHKILPEGAKEVSGEVGVFGVGYAAFVEFGTGIRGAQSQAMFDAFGQGGDLPAGYKPSGKKIYPKKAKRLVWEDRKSGNTVSAAWTKGMAPRPFLRPAVAENIDRMNKEYADELTKMVAKIGLAK